MLRTTRLEVGRRKQGVFEGMKRLFRSRVLEINVKRIVIPMALYGAETWSTGVPDKRLNIIKMR